MCTRPRAILLGLLIIVPIGAAPARAQDTGTVSGTVVDASGQVLPGVTMTLANEATGDTRAAASDERGHFAFRAVPPGSYTVRAELTGFRTYERRNTVVNASAIVALGSVKLEIGAINEVVSVVAEGTLVETKNSDYSGLLTNKQISQIQT